MNKVISALADGCDIRISIDITSATGHLENVQTWIKIYNNKNHLCYCLEITGIISDECLWSGQHVIDRSSSGSSNWQMSGCIKKEGYESTIMITLTPEGSDHMIEITGVLHIHHGQIVKYEITGIKNNILFVGSADTLIASSETEKPALQIPSLLPCHSANILPNDNAGTYPSTTLDVNVAPAQVFTHSDPLLSTYNSANYNGTYPGIMPSHSFSFAQGSAHTQYPQFPNFYDQVGYDSSYPGIMPSHSFSFAQGSAHTQYPQFPNFYDQVGHDSSYTKEIPVGIRCSDSAESFLESILQSTPEEPLQSVAEGGDRHNLKVNEVVFMQPSPLASLTPVQSVTSSAKSPGEPAVCPSKRPRPPEDECSPTPKRQKRNDTIPESPQTTEVLGEYPLVISPSMSELEKSSTEASAPLEAEEPKKLKKSRRSYKKKSGLVSKTQLYYKTCLAEKKVKREEKNKVLVTFAEELHAAGVNVNCGIGGKNWALQNQICLFMDEDEEILYAAAKADPVWKKLNNDDSYFMRKMQMINKRCSFIKLLTNTQSSHRIIISDIIGREKFLLRADAIMFNVNRALCDRIKKSQSFDRDRNCLLLFSLEEYFIPFLFKGILAIYYLRELPTTFIRGETTIEVLSKELFRLIQNLSYVSLKRYWEGKLISYMPLNDSKHSLSVESKEDTTYFRSNGEISNYCNHYVSDDHCLIENKDLPLDKIVQELLNLRISIYLRDKILSRFQKVCRIALTRIDNLLARMTQDSKPKPKPKPKPKSRARPRAKSKRGAQEHYTQLLEKIRAELIPLAINQILDECYAQDLGILTIAQVANDIGGSAIFSARNKALGITQSYETPPPTPQLCTAEGVHDVVGRSQSQEMQSLVDRLPSWSPEPPSTNPVHFATSDAPAFVESQDSGTDPAKYDNMGVSHSEEELMNNEVAAYLEQERTTFMDV